MIPGLKRFLITFNFKAKVPLKKPELILFLLLIFAQVSAQDKAFIRNSFITAGYNQINEGANFGLIFRGPGLNYGMTWSSTNEKRYITYEYELGVGILFSRQIPALGFYLKPFDLAWLIKMPSGEKKLYLGPLLKLEYNYNLYPDLQSGFDYWFTNLSLGIGALYDFNYKKSSFRIKLNSSFAGLLSRQEASRNPYFYDIGFKYAIRHLHQDLYLGSFDDYNATCFEILFKTANDARLTLGYFLKYSGFYNDPGITILNQGVKLIIGKKHK
jgi:hypothetical protein